MSRSPNENASPTVGVSELPSDELVHYGRQLGLELDVKMGRGELLRRVRERQELLLDLDRQALLDIVVWARRPVRASASKEELAKQIAAITRMKFAGLSDRGLAALARLRGLPVRSSDPRELIEARLRDAEPFWNRVRRRRREMVGGLLDRMIVGHNQEDGGEYRFLPEDPAASSLKERIADEGIVGGIAHKLRGVADDYVREKLDEIEARIDKKLDEIDQRLGEWRDKEITDRLRIIKITLVASALVALLSLAYNYLKG
jgi:tetrahydromethanopterin S-methyltransferase subunit G